MRNFISVISSIRLVTVYIIVFANKRLPHRWESLCTGQVDRLKFSDGVIIKLGLKI